MNPKDIQGSPYGFYGLEIDELTDLSYKAIVIMYIHFVNAMGQLTFRVSLCQRIVQWIYSRRDL